MLNFTIWRVILSISSEVSWHTGQFREFLWFSLIRTLLGVFQASCPGFLYRDRFLFVTQTRPFVALALFVIVIIYIHFLPPHTATSKPPVSTLF